LNKVVSVWAWLVAQAIIKTKLALIVIPICDLDPTSIGLVWHNSVVLLFPLQWLLLDIRKRRLGLGRLNGRCLNCLLH